ncbi:MAG: Hpt domain-containing protein [Gammaproteobacteria bacterium]|nr:Hpt domain-containing protein [Gammaproteobacteria bacterium]
MTDTLSVENKLLALKKQYIDSLTDKFSEISKLWFVAEQTRKIPDNSLESALHKLAGSAGMYDETELGNIARSVEIRISEIDSNIEDNTVSQIDSELEQLKIMITDLSTK